MSKADKISLDRAKPNNLVYYVPTVVVYREGDGKCLILKRHERETAAGGLYGVIGGKFDHSDLDLGRPSKVSGDLLEFDDAVISLLRREAEEEAGIKIDDQLVPLGPDWAFVRPDGVPVITGRYAAKYLSGEVALEQGAFTEFEWVDAASVNQFSCLAGIPEAVAAAIKAFSS